MNEQTVVEKNVLAPEIEKLQVIIEVTLSSLAEWTGKKTNAAEMIQAHFDANPQYADVKEELKTAQLALKQERDALKNDGVVIEMGEKKKVVSKRLKELKEELSMQLETWVAKTGKNVFESKDGKKRIIKKKFVISESQMPLFDK